MVLFICTYFVLLQLQLTEGGGLGFVYIISLFTFESSIVLSHTVCITLNYG